MNRRREAPPVPGRRTGTGDRAAPAPAEAGAGQAPATAPRPALRARLAGAGVGPDQLTRWERSALAAAPVHAARVLAAAERGDPLPGAEGSPERQVARALLGLLDLADRAEGREVTYGPTGRREVVCPDEADAQGRCAEP